MITARRDVTDPNLTGGTDLDPALSAYCESIFEWPLMREWTEGALAEPDEILELKVEF